MLQLDKDGMLSRTSPIDHDTGRIKETIELPVDLLQQQGNLIDRIFAFAFDMLDLQEIELRIRPPAAEGENRVRSQSIQIAP